MNRHVASGVIGVLVLLTLLVPACGGDQPSDGRPLVVTTTPVLYSLTTNVAGDTVRVVNLLPAGASPHGSSFTVEQVRLVTEAALVVSNGAGLDRWVEDLISSSGNRNLQRVVASRGVELQRASEPLAVPGSVSGEHEPTDVDPHVWLDVRNALKMVANIRDGLKKLDPAHAPDYDRRAAAYMERLEQLDGWIRARTATLTRKEFIAFHSAFNYYARAYGLQQVGVIEESPGKEPSPQYLAKLVDLVKRLGIKAVFAEPQFSARPAESLAREASVKVYVVDPEGSRMSADMYEEMMRSNTEVFVRALGSGA